MYGEKGSSAAVRRRARGSPPRMRGKAVSNSRLKHPDRITPAYTGKRKRRERPRWVASDHPRMCGEKISFFFTGCSPRGSPPHVRGKVVRCIRSAVPTGITPACAGKRGQGLQENGLGWDHPRMCGEKSLFELIAGLSTGSPPHVRGKGTGILQNLQRVGITPACAGKRSLFLSCCRTCRDHPRMCGEKHHRRHKRPCKWGSPPHVRGKADFLLLAVLHVGITPACAGKRQHQQKIKTASKDHPRMCGEKTITSSCEKSATGSPPHVRGKVQSNAKIMAADGITPAHAGKRLLLILVF